MPHIYHLVSIDSLTIPLFFVGFLFLFLGRIVCRRNVSFRNNQLTEWICMENGAFDALINIDEWIVRATELRLELVMSRTRGKKKGSKCGLYKCERIVWRDLYHKTHLLNEIEYMPVWTQPPSVSLTLYSFRCVLCCTQFTASPPAQQR